jgi:IMP dehydrogenase
VHITQHAVMDDQFPLGLSYDDVLLIPQYSEIDSRSQVDLSSKVTPKLSLKIPIISANMSDVTGVEMAISLGNLGCLGALPRFDQPETQAKEVSLVANKTNVVAAAIGCKPGFIDRAEELVKAGAKVLILDVAHGHMKQSVEATREIRNHFKDAVDIIAGNIATTEAAEALFEAGADSVKVGVGPGSICITRIVTGSGYPQLSAVMNAAKAARKYKKTVVADGGIKNSGDVAKALAAGASAVMVGNILAGTDESPGDYVEVGDKAYKVYNGSTSVDEKNNHVKKLSDAGKNYLKHIEGVSSLVPYKGSVEHIILQYEANIKSAFSYSGAWKLEEMWEKARFVRVSPLGQRENGAHDVITKE